MYSLIFGFDTYNLFILPESENTYTCVCVCVHLRSDIL